MGEACRQCGAEGGTKVVQGWCEDGARVGRGGSWCGEAAVPTCMLVTSLSLSCFVMSVCQSPPKLSKCTHVTGFGPSSDHIAISTAPVSEAGTMPMW